MMLDVATKMKQLLLDKLCDILIDQTWNLLPSDFLSLFWFVLLHFRTA